MILISDQQGSRFTRRKAPATSKSRIVSGSPTDAQCACIAAIAKVFGPSLTTAAKVSPDGKGGN